MSTKIVIVQTTDFSVTQLSDFSIDGEWIFIIGLDDEVAFSGIQRQIAAGNDGKCVVQLWKKGQIIFEVINKTFYSNHF